jgi:hypothetical protein
MRSSRIRIFSFVTHISEENYTTAAELHAAANLLIQPLPPSKGPQEPGVDREFIVDFLGSPNLDMKLADYSSAHCP